MKRSFFAIVAFIFISAIAALSQEVRNEVSVQATGFFTRDSNDQGISNKATQSGGVLAGYRHRINRWFSAEGNYGYNRSTEQYFTSGGSSRIQADVHSATGDLVVNLPFRFHKLLPYVLAGGGALIFSPTNNPGGFIPGADTQAQGAFVYGGGADYASRGMCPCERNIEDSFIRPRILVSAICVPMHGRTRLCLQPEWSCGSDSNGHVVTRSCLGA